MKREMKIYLCDNLVVLRKRKGWTQEEAADQIGVKRSRYGAWEEKRAKPSYEWLIIIADLYEVELRELLTTQMK